MEKYLEILEQPENVRRLAGECEVSGLRTIFTRNGRSVAILLSYDEYLALRETVVIAANAEVRTAIDEAEYEVKRNALMLVEDLIES